MRSILALLSVLCGAFGIGDPAAPGAVMERLPNGAPRFPDQFQAKVRMDVKYRYLQRPMLVLVHYDFPNQRLREDYYNLAGGRTERIFTSIKLYNDGKHFQVYHRNHDPALSTPRGCMVMPISAPLPYPSVLQWAIYHGAKNVTLMGETARGATALQSSTVNHWAVKYDNVTYQYYESVPEGTPVRLERPSMNITFIHFAAGPQTAAPGLFVPEAVASTSCTPIGG